MSDEKQIPGPPPPDDSSKTTPNINIQADDGGPTDWDKTNYNFPKQPAADDWGRTVTNIKPIDTEQQDFGKTFYPGAQPSPSDWGVTNANAKISDADFGSGADDFGGGTDKTTPYFRLPEADRVKYQNLPPTPTEKAAQSKKEQQEKGGIPGWVWVSGGLLSMFLFAIVVLLFVLFFFFRPTSFEVTVIGAPPGSTILVDDIQIAVTNPDGSFNLQNLEAGRPRTISVTHPNFKCEPQVIIGEAGVTHAPVRPKCAEVQVAPGEDCSNIKLGEVDKAERCHNQALDKLAKPFTVEELLEALNILIVNFDTNKSDVPKERLAALQKAAGFIKLLKPGVVLEIGGHTDNVGSDSKNLPLSDKRAKAVKDILVNYGVSADVLQTKGYGASQPKPGADNNTALGKFYNRRIQYSIAKR